MSNGNSWSIHKKNSLGIFIGNNYTPIKKKNAARDPFHRAPIFFTIIFFLI